MAQLSEPVRYAYAALFALSLNERYSTSCDREFRLQSMRRLLEHLKLMRVSGRAETCLSIVNTDSLTTEMTCVHAVRDGNADAHGKRYAASGRAVPADSLGGAGL